MNRFMKVDEKKVADFCKSHHIVKLAFFGSVLRDDFQPDSDVDVLVVFEREKEPGLFGFARMERELSEILNKKVDLRTPEDISRHFRDEVISQAEIQYAA